MNASEAQREGLEFTGCYDWNKDKPKLEAAKIRKLGYRAVTIHKPASKYSRGSHGGGYAVYAEIRYSLDQYIKSMEETLAHTEARKQAAFERYQAELAKIEKEDEETAARLAESKEKSARLLANMREEN